VTTGVAQEQLFEEKITLEEALEYVNTKNFT
jgi:hypothetical protein